MVSTLLLVPTEVEIGLVRQALGAVASIQVEMCGFGPIVSSARTAHLLAKQAPNSVVLLGIAGRYTDNLQVGHAYRFGEVACHGIGVTSGDTIRSAGQLGWQQWPLAPQIGDVLTLATSNSSRQLLTCCAASGSLAEAAARHANYPQATAEDMEGFAVAAACRLASKPLSIVRGISNTAGDRDHSQWQVERALESAIALVKRLLEL